MSIRPSDVRQYALAGAQARLDALRAEVATLIRTFPELGSGREAARRTSDHAASPRGRKSAGRRPMTAAQRKAVGERMAKYWAGRRRAKPGKRAPAKATKTPTVP